MIARGIMRFEISIAHTDTTAIAVSVATKG